MKVSRKVGRRKHSRHSSISRRRFRNNKNKKSSYKKRYGKTHRGGCWSGEKKGGARSRKYGHKRGKRFHRGGENVLLFSELPQWAIDRLNSNKYARMNNPYNFIYRRTDGVYALSKAENGLFDILVPTNEGRPENSILLFRHDKKNPNKYDKILVVTKDQVTNFQPSLGVSNIQGITLTDPPQPSGNYTFPEDNTNTKSFESIQENLNPET